MQPNITFCSRCRGMRVGCNQRYISHCLLCKQWLRLPSRLASLAALLIALVLTFPQPSASVFSGGKSEQSIGEAVVEARVKSVGPAVDSIDAFLKDHEVRPANRSRLAQSIVTSARKHDLNPRLIASVLIVESRGNPFAISDKNAVGIMQIHLPTWGHTADREGINLLKIEDNIDFGARILKNYVRRFGLWEGVKRYHGFLVDNPTSEQSAEEYVAKVQGVYERRQPTAS